MSTYEMSKEERKKMALVAVVETIECLRGFVEDVSLNPRAATPESVAALPKIAEAMATLFNAVYDELD